MRISAKVASVIFVSIFSVSGFAQDSEKKQEVLNALNNDALETLDCARYLSENQCNSLDRCRATKELLKQVRSAQATLQDVAVFTTNSNNCCCVQSMAGRKFIKDMLDVEGAKPEDLRYRSCYDLC